MKIHTKFHPAVDIYSRYDSLKTVATAPKQEKNTPTSQPNQIQSQLHFTHKKKEKQSKQQRKASTHNKKRTNKIPNTFESENRRAKRAKPKTANQQQ